MNQFILYLMVLLAGYSARAQNDFTGIAKYKITAEGNNNPVTDSMSVIFSHQKVKAILYLPDVSHPGKVVEKSFIDDFSAKKSIELNAQEMTYKTDTLKTGNRYSFVNTMKIGVSHNNMLCFQYNADSTHFDTLKIRSAYCLGSIEYQNSFIKNYFFLGIQPLIIDNRIVMDFIITKPGGIKQKIYISDIKKTEDVERYFNLKGFTPAN